jgi:basic membrane protein A
MRRILSGFSVILILFFIGCSLSTTVATTTSNINTQSSNSSETHDLTTTNEDGFYYEVSFDSMGGNSIEPIYAKAGSSIYLPIPSREGYTFLGWFTGNGPNDTHFSVLSTVSYNITLYARWEINQYTITFNSNGGSLVNSLTQNYGTIIFEPNEPEKEGFVFKGWFLDNGFTQEFEFITMPSSNIILYAKWDKNPEKIILITDKGSIFDNSYNQEAFEGVQNYAIEMGIEYGYLIPADATDADYIDAIEQAIADGATVIVTPGFLFETAINAMQIEYPNVKFILIDANPANVGTLAENTHSIYFAEEQAGFLAGYAAVMEGYRHLGFMGGLAVPAIQRYGHGYIQGIAKASRDLGLPDGLITVDYLYTGDFKATPEVQAAAAAMYNSGVEVIFACGGSIGQSVMAAANTARGKVIGYDLDQSANSSTVITSAIKNYALSVELALTAIFEDGTWDNDFGGVSVVLGAEVGGIGLTQDFSRFENFDQTDYDTLYEKLVDGTIVVSSVIGQFGDDGTAALQFAGTVIELNIIIFEG